MRDNKLRSRRLRVFFRRGNCYGKIHVLSLFVLCGGNEKMLCIKIKSVHLLGERSIVIILNLNY